MRLPRTVLQHLGEAAAYESDNKRFEKQLACGEQTENDGAMMPEQGQCLTAKQSL